MYVILTSKPGQFRTEIVEGLRPLALPDAAPGDAAADGGSLVAWLEGVVARLNALDASTAPGVQPGTGGGAAR